MLSGSMTDPASRFRILQFAEPLRARGHEVAVRASVPSRQWKSALPDGVFRRMHSGLGAAGRLINAVWRIRDLEKFDVVMMNRDLVPEVKVRFLEPWMYSRKAKIVFDFDDAIHLGPRREKIEGILKLSQGAAAGNDTLAAFARAFQPRRCAVIPTVADTLRWVPQKERRAGPFRAGWSGSVGSFSLAAPLLKKISECLTEVDQEAEFVLVLEKDPRVNWGGRRVIYRRWTERSEVELIQDFDVGLMPLEDSPFERGKCGLKAVQYMACGIPALVSPVGVNREIVHHDKTGFHCSTFDQWRASLTWAVQNRDKLAQMGLAGRERAVKFYSVDAVLAALEDLLKTASEGGANV